MPTTEDHTARLEELRAALRAENISMSELAELQGLAEFIDPADVELLEAAGVPEFQEETDDEQAVRWLALSDAVVSLVRNGIDRDEILIYVRERMDDVEDGTCG